MFLVEGSKITMSRGDTGSIKIAAMGHTFASGDRALFSVKNKFGQIVKQDIYQLTTGAFTAVFANTDTDMLPPGRYLWDVRYVTEPSYDEGGNIVNGTQIITPMEPQPLVLLDIVGCI